MLPSNISYLPQTTIIAAIYIFCFSLEHSTATLEQTCSNKPWCGISSLWGIILNVSAIHTLLHIQQKQGNMVNPLKSTILVYFFFGVVHRLLKKKWRNSVSVGHSRQWLDLCVKSVDENVVKRSFTCVDVNQLDFMRSTQQSFDVY